MPTINPGTKREYRQIYLSILMGVAATKNRALVAAIGVLAFSGISFADDALDFISPAEDAEVGLSVDQPVHLRWTRGDRPVGGRDIALSTTHGTLSSSTVTTGANGFANVTISADAEGNAEIVATTDTTSAALHLRFIDQTGFADPYDQIAITENPNGQMEIRVFNERIGFRGQPGITVGDVASIANDEGLIQLSPLDDNIFVLGSGTSMDRAALRQRADQLRRAYPDVIQKTGLVAKVSYARQWLVIPDEVIVRFVAGPTDGDIREFLAELEVDGARARDNDPRRYLLKLASSSTEDAIGLTRRLSKFDDFVKYAEPNYMFPRWLRDPTTDEGFKWQWHLENSAAYGGMADADVDAALGWEFGTGSPDTLIAVIDRGFDVSHPDLAANLWTSLQGDKGIDLIDGDAADLLSISASPTLYAHGTRAAGVAAAVGGNTIGYSGACPSCKLLLIRIEGDLDYADEAIRAAIDQGADVISNSWGAFGTYPDLEQAVTDAVAAGITVVYAISNYEEDNCGAVPDTSAHPGAIAVGGLDDFDMRTEVQGEAMGYGDCVDVLGLTRGGDQGISTTSVKKLPAGPTSTYWSNFGGTSAATPLVAGVAGLLSDLNANLSPREIQRVLQDTADRAEPAAALYSSEFGYSNPTGESTHAYGRINASEAARLVAPKVASNNMYKNGRGGQDLLLRDHALDWGNTEQSSNTIFSTPRQYSEIYKSTDIKIDVDPYQPAVTTPEQFAALVSEEPQIGKDSRVYVRIRNRGTETVPQASLKLIWAIVGDNYPDLPTDFWTAFPNYTDVTTWKSLLTFVTEDIEYSGPSIAGCPGRNIPECLPAGVVDVARIVMFSVGAQDWNTAVHRGPAYFAVIDSNDDRAMGLLDPANASLEVLEHVNGDNNVTLWTPGTSDTAPLPPEGCNSDTLLLVTLIIGVAFLLLLYVIWRWITGTPVPQIVYFLLILALIVLLYICMTYPGCIEQALPWR